MSARRVCLARSRGLAFALLFGALVAACSEGDPTPSATTMHPGTPATSTATPSGNPTDLAASAAIAAVQKLYAELNLGLRSGSTAAYRASFTTDCTVCISNANEIDRLKRRHERIHGGNFYVSQLMVVWNKPDLIVVQGKLRSDPLVIRAGSRVVGHDSGAKLTAFAWHVKPIAGASLITDVQVLK